MKSRVIRLRIAITYVGSVLLVFGFVLLIPFCLAIYFAGGAGLDVRPGTFAIPVAVSLLLGGACWGRVTRPRSRRTLGTADAMLVCVLSWLAVSAIGALPFAYHLRVPYVDAYFEAMSGFTTTGITMLQGLDSMPRSLLLWRSLTQWVGGLGILTFFLAVVYQGGLSHALFSAESHKMSGPRIAPGMWHTLKILWFIYVALTALVALGLVVCGTGVYDAVSHAFTCLSTGGYSPHDASIAHYEAAGHARHVAVEYVLVFGMWAGGTNFLIHYRLLTGKVRSLWDSDEMRAWWLVLVGATAVVLVSRMASRPDARFGESVRHSLFQVVSIATTTGFATRDIAGDYFTPLARQVFLVLMFVGGCVGSTGGGVKVVRVVLLWKVMVNQVRRATAPPSEVQLVMMDRKPVRPEETQRAAGLFFAWVLLLAFGSATTAALSRHDALASASGMFSALGNIGPCYIPVSEMAALNPVVKIVYILGMLAGRLEVLPLLMLVSRRAWH